MSRILLFGNPNVGKTSVYNSLTNSNERVSNFEGVTVEKKLSESIDGKHILIDIPGVYSLNSNSLSEKVSLDSLIKETSDSIIDVIDINDLRRNFFLLIDLLETGKPVNAILNMDDLFVGNINIESMSSKMPINIYKTNNKSYSKDLRDVFNFKENDFKIKYSKVIEDAIKIIEPLVIEHESISNRFFAIQYLKGSEDLLEYFNDKKKVKKVKENLVSKVETSKSNNSLIGLFFQDRRNFIKSVLDDTYNKESTKNEGIIFNSKFDKIALHKYFGLLLFVFIMYLVFFISIQGAILQEPIEMFIGYMQGILDPLFNNLHAPIFLKALINDGIIAGVGSVLVFLPQIIVLFALLTFLEAVGYFNRVNALFEKFFNKIGLSSTSIIPYISGLGCNVLAIMSTRNIKSEPKRIATILSSPFISCSARIPVYMIFANVFFEDHKALILLFLHMLGIIVAIAYAYVVDKIIYKDNEKSDILHIPDYKQVEFRYLYKITLAKVKSFLKNAGKLILIGSILIWALSSIGIHGYTTDIDQSFLGPIASVLSITLVPLGFGTSAAFASLSMSFLAKELAVTTMVVMYQVNSVEQLQSVIHNEFTFASAISFMVFTLLYIPCLSTIGTIYAETKSKKIVTISIVSSLTIGYILSFIIYHIVLLFS